MTDELPAYLNNYDPDEFFHNNNSVCEYFTTNEYTNFCASNQFQFNLLNFNIRSLNANRNKFEALLSYVNSNHNFLILSETWINPNSVNFRDV